MKTKIIILGAADMLVMGSGDDKYEGDYISSKT